MVIVLIGQFIKNIGGLPCSYVFMALFADVLDHVEWKNGFRCDGIAMSIYNTIAVASVGICTGIFNLILSKSGYAAPYTNAAGQLIAVQSASVKSAITFTFVGLETITGIVLAILLLFLNVEKNIAKAAKLANYQTSYKKALEAQLVTSMLPLLANKELEK